MCALQAIGSPGALGRQRVPARATLVLQGASSAKHSGRHCHSGHALLILAVVVQAGAELPIKSLTRIALEGDTMHGVGLAVVAHSHGCGCQRVAFARNIDGAAVDGLAVGPGQIALCSTTGVVLPPAQRITGTQRGRDVISQLDLGMVLLRVVLRGRTQHIPRLVGGVQTCNRTSYWHARIPWHASRLHDGGESQWLAFAVRAVEVDPERPVARLAAYRCAAVPAVEGVAAAIKAVGLRGIACADMGFKLAGHACHIVHHGTG